VQKINPFTISNLLVNPNWTYVTNPGPYLLKAASPAQGSGILRIKATQGNKTSYAALVYDPDASPEFNEKEDAASLFFDQIGLTLYSLTPLKSALAINVNGNFSAQPTYLGLRAKEAGEITLEFYGLPTFGHAVTLKDAQQNKSVELKDGVPYTFTVTKPAASSTFFDVNDRISLILNYTGNGIGTRTEAVELPALQVSSTMGYIHVHSAYEISSLQVYSVTGALVFSSNKAATEYRIPAISRQMYIVRALLNNSTVTEKVITD
jgi:hypothetical protein